MKLGTKTNHHQTIYREQELTLHLHFLGVVAPMVLGKLPVPGRPTIWMIVGQGPIVLAVGAGGGCLDIFTLVYLFFPLFPFSGRWPDID